MAFTALCLSAPWDSSYSMANQERLSVMLAGEKSWSPLVELFCHWMDWLILQGAGTTNNYLSFLDYIEAYGLLSYRLYLGHVFKEIVEREMRITSSHNSYPCMCNTKNVFIDNGSKLRTRLSSKTFKARLKIKINFSLFFVCTLK